MDKDIFADTTIGKAALAKFKSVPENFRLYKAGWLGKPPDYSDTMEVTGAEFRAAKTGVNKGKLSMLIKGTERTVYVTSQEMEVFK